jgi:solute carrier family 25 carnitine/acylcarnitine transporter 20/29
MPQHEDAVPNVKKIANRPQDLTDVSRAVLRSEQAKRWTKRYRTEVAASSSSLLSTFVAVGASVPLRVHGWQNADWA